MPKSFIVPTLSVLSFAATLFGQPASGGAPGFVPPDLHPEGVELLLDELGKGVYSLLATRPPADNAGFVVGERGVVVIDAHVDRRMARRIIDAVRSVTDKPILYLVNTNYHADHTFGNDAFPETTHVVAQRETARLMEDFEGQKKRMLVTVRNDPSVFAEATLRLPDVVFDERLTIDLGGRTVELYFFGAGNTLGDTVVYLPDERVAWTGNLVFGEGSLPFLLAGRPGRYLRTIARFAEALEVQTIIPGHGRPTTGAILGRYLDYLQHLVVTVQAAHRQGATLRETLASSPLPERFEIPPGQPSTPFYEGLHPFNLQRAFLEAQGEF